MGEDLLNIWKNKIKKEYKIAFIIAFVLTMFIHIYRFTNYIPNADTLFNYYFDQDVIESGRWSLGLACSISSYFDLSWVIGILSSAYMGFITITIVALFKIKNPVVIGLTAGLLASSPCTIDLFHYLYTADGYLLGLFLAALSVYLSRIDEKRKFLKFIAIILLCISCAIYQANVSFALMLTLCSILQVIIEGKIKKKKCIKWIASQVMIYIISLALYYFIWKLLLKVRGIEPYDYLGIAYVGDFGFEYIRHGLVSSFRTFFEFFFLWDMKTYGIVQYNLYSILFFIALIGILVFVVAKNKIYKQRWAIIILVLTLLLFIPASSFWYFTSLDLLTSNYLPKMLYGLIIIYIFAVILYEKYANKKIKNLFACLIVLIIFYNFIMANISYFCMQIIYEKNYAEASEMMNKINELTANSEDYVNEIVFVGERIDLYSAYNKDGSLNELSKYKVVLPLMHKTLTFDYRRAYLFLRNSFRIPYYMIWDTDYQNSFKEVKEVKEMGVWPADNSIIILENKIIVKLSEK